MADVVAHRALVITASTRAAAGLWEDRSGAVLRDGLAALDLEVDGPVVVADGEPVEEALRAGIVAGYHLIVTTGGTGLTPTDLTPEMTARVIDRHIPGIAEALRAGGVAAGVPTAVLSRRFVELGTGRHATLGVIHCGDVRDMNGHYPPSCYPSSGWHAREGGHDSRTQQPRALP